MKAAITGANGFVGPHLSSHLRSAGDTVSGFGMDNGPDLLDSEGWIETISALKPDVIYHLAGWSDVGASWNSPIKAVQINALGTLSILEAARRCPNNVRVIVVSSADIYGTVQPNDLPLTETSTVQPCSPYGASKQSAEALAAQYHRGFDVETIVARPFNHIGPGQATKFIASSFAAQIAAAEKTGEGKITHGNLTPKRDLTDVRDVVRAYRHLAVSGQPGDTYNICSGTAVSMKLILTTLVNEARVTITTEPDQQLFRPVELPVLEGSNTKLSSATGWEPRFSLPETLTDVLEDARSRSTSHP